MTKYNDAKNVVAELINFVFPNAHYNQDTKPAKFRRAVNVMGSRLLDKVTGIEKREIEYLIIDLNLMRLQSIADWNLLASIVRTFIQKRERANSQSNRQRRSRPNASDNKRSWYEVLEVASNAAANEVKKAYRRMAMKNHPDRGGDTEVMQQINVAWKQYSAMYA